VKWLIGNDIIFQTFMFERFFLGIWISDIVFFSRKYAHHFQKIN